MRPMISVFMAVVVLGTLSSCASLMLGQTRYDYDLDKTSKVEDSKGKLSIINLQARRVEFQYTNKSPVTQKILWDESVIVDLDGKPRKIVHDGVKYNQAGESMTPSIVPSGGQITDFLTYADALQFAGAGGWIEGEIIYCSSSTAICDPGPSYGRTLTVLLTVESNGKKEEYQAKMIVKKREHKQK